MSAEAYPFFVIPVSELLELSEWHPHQRLLPKLINLTADPSAADGREILFVSHQVRPNVPSNPFVNPPGRCCLATRVARDASVT